MLKRNSFANIVKNNKKIILFGSGNIAEKTLRSLDKGLISHIVDNSPNLQGTKYQGFDIKEPNTISGEYLVIICSTAITSISDQLISLGLVSGEDFVLSPILNDLVAIVELEEIDQTIYFTSGTTASKEKNIGGGLYKCIVNGSNVLLSRLYSGPCYGMIEKENELLFIDTDNGIFSCNRKTEKIIKKAELPHGSRAHGISYNESTEKFYISCSDYDQIIELDKNFREIRRFNLSNKYELHKEAMHHCNDNLAIGNSLYVSMFSSSGNWKKDCFDGCIAEFDIESGERRADIISDLYMPHNVKFYNGSLHVLDSLPGHLRFGNFSIQGTFPAFTRGLSFNSGLYFIGQSKNRNYSRVMGLSNNTSIDCGIIAFNSETKVSRFFQLSNKIGEIHSLIAFDN